MLYCRSQDDPLDWESWDSTHLVFQHRSGQTHFLNELGAWLLRRIEHGPRTESELVDELVAEHEAEQTQELVQSVRQTLTVLDQLGLISAAGKPV